GQLLEALDSPICDIGKGKIQTLEALDADDAVQVGIGSPGASQRDLYDGATPVAYDFASLRLDPRCAGLRGVRGKGRARRGDYEQPAPQVRRSRLVASRFQLMRHSGSALCSLLKPSSVIDVWYTSMYFRLRSAAISFTETSVISV